MWDYSSHAVCEMTKTGVAAIFGPRSRTTAAHVQSMCEALGVPHVETRWDHRETRRDHLSVNVHPHPESLGKVRRIYRMNESNILSMIPQKRVCSSPEAMYK